ncbi:MAG: GNAT family N-acetyltransferase [Flavobacteriales bacterium]|nr:GNAT family N-acetyltransferase [Flavobacteriales bacterium]
MSVTIRTLPFYSLSLHQLHDLLLLRERIFVVEQQCIYPEIDGLDPDCLHVIAEDERGELVACARILPPDQRGVPHIGRVAVRIDKRGGGIARELMRIAMQESALAHGTEKCALAAQTYLEGFYASLGFLRTSDDYLLDGLPHVDMAR